MHTCLMCGLPSGNSKFCRDCRTVKRNAGASVYQNSGKLRKLINPGWLSPDKFEKFILYTSNIIENGKIVVGFQKCEDLRKVLVNGLYEVKK